MRGTIERCWLFTFRAPAEAARRELPPGLAPVTRGDLAFWNVVVSHIGSMRPEPLPAVLGVSYWHVAYRLYVRFAPPGGEPIEGLYFARSDCDSRLMVLAGNLLTDYRFHTAGVRVDDRGRTVEMRVEAPEAAAHATISRAATPELPPGSAFGSLDEAAAWLKYRPFGISVDTRVSASVVRIRRREDLWRSRVVGVVAQEWAFFRGREVSPELCFEVEPIEYAWERARSYAAPATSRAG